MINRKVLLVSAHPSSDGWVSKIAKEYANRLKKSNISCVWIDLYREAEQQTFLGYDDGDVCEIDVAQSYQKKITSATELILLYPVWWGGPPAILKNWLDNNFTPKFAYQYEPHSKWYKKTLKPRGMLSHIRVHQLVTTGDYAWKYRLTGSPATAVINKIFVEFCGMRRGGVKVFGGFGLQKEMDMSGVVAKGADWLYQQIAK